MARNDMVGVNHGGILWDDDKQSAVQFEVEAHGETTKVWLPRSEIQDYDDDTLIIPEWLAEERGIDPDWEL